MILLCLVLSILTCRDVNAHAGGRPRDVRAHAGGTPARGGNLGWRLGLTELRHLEAPTPPPLSQSPHMRARARQRRPEVEIGASKF